jgi:hypothetical protein
MKREIKIADLIQESGAIAIRCEGEVVEAMFMDSESLLNDVIEFEKKSWGNPYEIFSEDEIIMRKSDYTVKSLTSWKAVNDKGKEGIMLVRNHFHK